MKYNFSYLIFSQAKVVFLLLMNELNNNNFVDRLQKARYWH